MVVGLGSGVGGGGGGGVGVGVGTGKPVGLCTKVGIRTYVSPVTSRYAIAEWMAITPMIAVVRRLGSAVRSR
jgi:hypothetical protein